MNPFYLIIGYFVLIKKLVDLIFGGIGMLFAAGSSPAPTKLSDDDIEIYEPEKDDKNAG